MQKLTFSLVESMKNQWKSLRENYKRCMSKRNLMSRSGAASSKLPRCKFFEQLVFLTDTICSRGGGESNVTLDNENSNSFSDVQSNVSSPDDNQYRDLSFISPPEKKSKNRKEEQHTTALDVAIEKTMKEINQTTSLLEKAESQSECEDLLFCRSLVPTLKRLPNRKKCLAKIRIRELLFHLEFDDE